MRIAGTVDYINVVMSKGRGVVELKERLRLAFNGCKLKGV